MNEQYNAHITNDSEYEYHIVNGVLYITSESNPDKQVALSKQAQKELVRYILQQQEHIR